MIALWTELPESVKERIRSYICHPVAQLIKEFDAQREAAPHLTRLDQVRADLRDTQEMLHHFHTLEWQLAQMTAHPGVHQLREQIVHTTALLELRDGYEAVHHELAQREERLHARLRLLARSNGSLSAGTP